MSDVATLKSDKVLATEAQEILEQLVAKMNELASRQLVVTFNLSNGVDGKPAAISAFTVIKKVLEATA